MARLKGWLRCQWLGHDLTPPYRFRQRCGRCGLTFGSMDPP